MESNQETGTQKQRDFGSMASCLAGAGVWWFLCSEPSPVALTVAAILLAYLFLGFCLLAVLLPGPDTQRRQEAFVPLPQNDFDRPKSLTL
jgi:hypothetical protein